MHIPIGAKDATIALLGAEEGAAAGTDMQHLSGVRRHGQLFGKTALGTGKGRLEYDFHQQLLIHGRRESVSRQ
jgi:hypothetical protein